MRPDEAVTLVVTSCGRHDLLRRTLESFCEYNTYPITRLIVVEDGSDLPSNAFILQVTNKIRHISAMTSAGGPRVGQLRAIDAAYARVKTPFIFHCEDDWTFYKPGFIEASLKILREHRNIVTVWLREHFDTNGHPLEYNGGLELLTPAYKGEWYGFTLNPGLRRLADYQIVAPFAQYHAGPGHAGQGEAAISKRYWELGFRAAITPDGFVRHIGVGRQVTA